MSDALRPWRDLPVQAPVAQLAVEESARTFDEKFVVWNAVDIFGSSPAPSRCSLDWKADFAAFDTAALPTRKRRGGG